MTRQAFEALAKRLSQSTDVSDVRAVASFTSGQMLLECTAPDRPALDAWMAKEHLVPSDVIRLDVQVENGDATAFA
jgi:hypothetical protein